MFCVSMYEPCGLCARCRVRNCLQVLIKFSLIYCTRAGPAPRTEWWYYILVLVSTISTSLLPHIEDTKRPRLSRYRCAAVCRCLLPPTLNTRAALCWAGLGWPGMQFSFLKLELSEERLGPGLGAGANLPPNFPLSSQTFHDTLAPDN